MSTRAFVTIRTCPIQRHVRWSVFQLFSVKNFALIFKWIFFQPAFIRRNKYPFIDVFHDGVLSGLSLMYGVWTVWIYRWLTDLKSAIVYNLVFAGGGSFIIPSWNSPCNYGLYVLALHFLLFGTESHRKHQRRPPQVEWQNRHWKPFKWQWRHSALNVWK